ncbi:MAG: hypothetical protein LUQ07_01745 [Methanospirillum sp.]|nr:hypothetical protein [Methanospirillum sp.]
MEDYLETIYVLSKNKGYARTGEIAKALNVSPSSVVEMVGKISRLGYLEWKRYEGVYLSPEGRMKGEIIHIRHETLRKFFEFIGVAPDIANKEACIIEHELSPITTSAIGNLVRFLQTPAGTETISALGLFLKIRDAGFPCDLAGIFIDSPRNETKLQPTLKTPANQEILSVITRHDLMNTIHALTGYLNVLASLPGSEEINPVLLRLETRIQAMGRQISADPDHLVAGISIPRWMNLRKLVMDALRMTDINSLVFEYRLGSIEIFGDPLLEKAVGNILEYSIRHGGDLSRMVCGYKPGEKTLTWFIQNEGKEIPLEEKMTLFQTTGKSQDDNLYVAYQIFTACGMEIRETGKPGEGIRFEITIPEGLFQTAKLNLDITPDILGKVSGDEPGIPVV